ncbi:c-type cytochrome [Blattabacterium cuenoti]|uniref:c-type cytochrome n=1 Tax=Blattabacterium cuenoti TaxID=1653831 RepID=UPI00163C6E31|nr:c-type cytochrome [Blattabacterium cuenoti]
MKKILFPIFLFSFIFLLKSEDITGNPENGLYIFKKNCTTCHSIKLKEEMIGPALHGVTERRSREWLIKWIKDNKSLRESGDKNAIAIYKKYNNVEMNSFSTLSDNQIDDILSFIRNPNIKKDIDKKNNKIEVTEIGEKKFLIKLIIFCFSIFSLISFWVLYRIYILTKLLNETKEDPVFKKIDFPINILYKKFLGRKKNKWYLLSSFMIFFVLLGIYGIWSFMMKIDVNKGYKPEQPIYFSHKIHSGINEIDCQYCHFTAKYGKVSGIPSANVCMNCHITIDEYNGNYIEKGKSIDYYNKEIQKIYYAVGWDPKKRKYSEKTHPIKWVRIHNMPDFVHFDHSQHIITGEKMIKKFKNVDLICQACHGEVQKMDQVEMSNNFTMEWCISCHKNAEIDKNNQYYKYHFPITNNNKKITVDMIGGTECAKCHY